MPFNKPRLVRVYNVRCYFFKSSSQRLTDDFKICIYERYWTIARWECRTFIQFKQVANVCTVHVKVKVKVSLLVPYSKFVLQSRSPCPIKNINTNIPTQKNNNPIKTNNTINTIDRCQSTIHIT